MNDGVGTKLPVGSVIINGEAYKLSQDNTIQQVGSIEIGEPPWEEGVPPILSERQFTWHQGGFKSRQGLPGTSEYGKNTDPRWPFRLAPGPEITNITLTDSDTKPSAIFEALGYIWVCCGRRVFRINPVDDSVAESKDFGTGFRSISGTRWEEDYGLVTVNEDAGSEFGTLAATGLESGKSEDLGTIEPSVEDSSEGTSTTISPNITHTFDAPTTVTAGNLILIILQVYSTRYIESIEGFNEYFRGQIYSEQLQIFTKVADGTEGGGTFSGDISYYALQGINYQVFSIQDWDGDIANSLSISSMNGVINSTTIDPNAITIDWGTDRPTLLINIVNSSEYSDTVVSYPSGYSNGNDTTADHAAGTLATSQKTVTAASDDPGTYTGTSVVAERDAITIGIKGTTYKATTGSITPVADELTILTIANKVASGTPNQPTVSGAGMTWSVLKTVTAGQDRLTVFIAQRSNPSVGTITLDFDIQDQSSVHWSVVSITDAFVGASVAEAVEQSDSDSGSDSSATITLAAFQRSENGAFGAFAVLDATGITPGSGFSEIHETTESADTMRLETEFQATSDTTVDASWTGTQTYLAIAIELIVSATTTQLLWKVTAIGSPDTWTQSADVVANLLAAGSDRLFKISLSGELKNIVSGLDPMSEANWADLVQMGNTFDAPTVLVAYDKSVVVGKPEALYSVGPDGEGHPEVQRVSHFDQNFIGSIVAEPWVYLPHSRGMFRWQPGLVESVGLEKEILNESGIVGHVHTMATSGEWLYAFMDTHETDTYLLVGRERRPNELGMGPIIWDTLSYYTGLTEAAYVQGEPGRLWFGNGNNISYIRLPEHTGGTPDIDSDEYRFATSGSRYTNKYRYNDWGNKDFHRVKLAGKNLNANRYWVLNYSVDGAAYSDLDKDGNQMKMIADSLYTFELPRPNTGREIQYRLDFSSTSNTIPPEIEYFEPMAQPQSSKVSVWNMVLELKDDQVHDDRIDTREAETQLADLESISRQRTPFQCTGPWGDNTYMLCRKFENLGIRRGTNGSPIYTVQMSLQETSNG